MPVGFKVKLKGFFGGFLGGFIGLSDFWHVLTRLLVVFQFISLLYTLYFSASHNSFDSKEQKHLYDFKTLWYFENWNFTCRHFCLSYIGWVHLNCIFHLLLISKLCVRITLNCKVGKPYIQLASNVKYVHLSEFIDKVKISRWTGRNLKEKFL